MKLDGGPLEHTTQPTVLHCFFGSTLPSDVAGCVEVEGGDEDPADELRLRGEGEEVEGTVWVSLS